MLPDGVRLAVWESGEGEPLLLLHAWGETHRSFDQLVRVLPEGLRLVVPDQRGVGDSDKPTHGYALREAAADMIGLLDGLDVERAWVLGTSSGGYVAQQLVVAHPDRVIGLVLVGAPRSLAGSDPFGQILAGFHDPVTPADVSSVNDHLGLSPGVPRDFLAMQDAAALTIPRHVWQAGYRGLIEAPPPLDGGAIHAPTLVLTGDEDDMLGRGDAQRLVREIADSRLVRYPQTGHMVLWERPEWVARDAAEFIQGRG